MFKFYSLINFHFHNRDEKYFLLNFFTNNSLVYHLKKLLVNFLPQQLEKIHSSQTMPTNYEIKSISPNALLILMKYFSSLTADNATKFCHANGTWDKTYYDNCLIVPPQPVPTHDVEHNTFIYCIGYLLSIIVLSIAVIIFVTFK